MGAIAFTRNYRSSKPVKGLGFQGPQGLGRMDIAHGLVYGAVASKAVR